MGCCEFFLARLVCAKLVHSPAEQWLGCRCRLELVTFCKARCSGVEYGNEKIFLRHHNDNDNRCFKEENKRKAEERKKRKEEEESVRESDTGVIGKEVREIV